MLFLLLCVISYTHLDVVVDVMLAVDCGDRVCVAAVVVIVDVDAIVANLFMHRA